MSIIPEVKVNKIEEMVFEYDEHIDKVLLEFKTVVGEDYKLQDIVKTVFFKARTRHENRPQLYDAQGRRSSLLESIVLKYLIRCLIAQVRSNNDEHYDDMIRGINYEVDLRNIEII